MHERSRAAIQRLGKGHDGKQQMEMGDSSSSRATLRKWSGRSLPVSLQAEHDDLIFAGPEASPLASNAVCSLALSKFRTATNP